MVFLFHKCWVSIIQHMFSFLVILNTVCAHNIGGQKSSNRSTTLAIFVFGDSTVDPGNNNHLKTIFRSDFSPYGVDFLGHTPTGRFSNGRLATDFIASYAGIKETIPAYLDPKLSLEDLTTGVSFASAGSGYDPLTAAKGNVMGMDKQLEYLDEYMIKIKSMIGEKRMKDLMKRSLFLISCGTNDVMYTFGIVESPIQSLTAPAYLHFLLHKSKSFVQGLIDRGAEKIGVVGLPPVGCLPAVITVHPNYKARKCVESLSKLAIDFNQMLQTQLKTIQISQPTTTVIYGDIYTPLHDQINHPLKYGFEEVDMGCCGSGLLESSILCNSLKTICSDRSKYLFWDSIHPTERSYYFIFETLRPLIDYVLSR